MGEYFLKEVFISEGIKEIKEATFQGCDNLEFVLLPESLERIERDAFSYCNNLKQIYIPENVHYISPYAFSGNDITVVLGSSEYLKSFASRNRFQLDTLENESGDVFNAVIIMR